MPKNESRTFKFYAVLDVTKVGDDRLVGVSYSFNGAVAVAEDYLMENKGVISSAVKILQEVDIK